MIQTRPMTQARLLALVAALLLPATARAQPVSVELDDPAGPPSVQVPTPPGYGVAVDAERPTAQRPRRRGGYMPTWPILVPGLAAFVVTYGSSAVAGAVLIADGITEEGAWLLTPIVGPLVLSADLADPGDVALFVALGVAQAAGIALIIAGLALNSRAGTDEVALVPLVSPSIAGLAARGSF